MILGARSRRLRLLILSILFLRFGDPRIRVIVELNCALSILFLRFQARWNRSWSGWGGYFQFSFWDSKTYCPRCRLVFALFQFSFWDSRPEHPSWGDTVRISWRLSILFLRFISLSLLCLAIKMGSLSILFLRFGRGDRMGILLSEVHDFQFSFWDSSISRCPNPRPTRSFNSLFEIPKIARIDPQRWIEDLAFNSLFEILTHPPWSARAVFCEMPFNSLFEILRKRN